MFDMNPLRVELGPGGKYERLGALFARILRPKSDVGRYLLAIMACIGLFFVFTAFAAVTGLLEVKSASRVMTPVFIVTLVLTWKSIVERDKKALGSPVAKPAQEQAETPRTSVDTPPNERPGGSIGVSQQFETVESEHSAVLDAYCPNCAMSLSRVAIKCKQCGADFSGEDGWKPVSSHPEIKDAKPLNLYSVERIFTLAVMSPRYGSFLHSPSMIRSNAYLI
jgi:hypothetical protein